MKIGEASQISIGVHELDVSISHYQKLGFRVVHRDARPYPWAQLSDDSVLLLLNQDGMQYIGLLYFSASFPAVVSYLRSLGIEFLHEIRQGEILSQVFFHTPDGFVLSVVNHDAQAMYQPKGPNYLSMSEAQHRDVAGYPNKNLGFFGEFCHQVKDFQVSRAFWEKLGFECVFASEGPYHWGLMKDAWQIIGLHETTDFDYPAITYFAKDSRQKIEALRKAGISDITQFTGTGGNEENVVITSPEGQKVFLFNF